MSRLSRIFSLALGIVALGLTPVRAWAAPDALDYLKIQESENEAQVEIGTFTSVPRYILQRKGESELSIDIVGVFLPAEGMNVSGSSSLLMRSIAAATAGKRRMRTWKQRGSRADRTRRV